MFKRLRPVLDDSFQRTNAIPPSPSPQGYTYSSPIGTVAQIKSNQLGGLNDDWVAITGLRAGPLRTVDAKRDNWKQQRSKYDITYTFQTGTDRFGQGTDFINIYLRYRDANNRLFVELTVNHIALYSYINGGLATLQNVAQNKYTNVAPTSIHTMIVSVRNNTILVYLDGTLYLNVTTALLATAQGFGVHQRANDGFGIRLAEQ